MSDLAREASDAVPPEMRVRTRRAFLVSMTTSTALLLVLPLLYRLAPLPLAFASAIALAGSVSTTMAFLQLRYRPAWGRFPHVNALPHAMWCMLYVAYAADAQFDGKGPRGWAPLAAVSAAMILVSITAEMRAFRLSRLDKADYVKGTEVQRGILIAWIPVAIGYIATQRHWWDLSEPALSTGLNTWLGAISLVGALALFTTGQSTYVALRTKHQAGPKHASTVRPRGPRSSRVRFRPTTLKAIRLRSDSSMRHRDSSG